VLRYQRTRRAVVIDTLAVSPGARRRGVGRRLLADMKGSLLLGGTANRLRVFVPDDNLGAHLFLKACGFHGFVKGEALYKFVFRHSAAEVVRACS
jgi:ribosomal protein S18 acetylase RimI-like enzyme